MLVEAEGVEPPTSTLHERCGLPLLSYAPTASLALTRMMPRELLENYCNYFSILFYRKPKIRG